MSLGSVYRKGEEDVSSYTWEQPPPMGQGSGANLEGRMMGTARSQQGRHFSVIALTLLWQLERVTDRTQLTQ